MPFTIGGDWIPSDKGIESPKSSKPVKVRCVKRKQKLITVVLNLGSSHDMKGLASELKRACACGGTVQEGVIELQGDRVDQVREELRKRGVKAQ